MKWQIKFKFHKLIMWDDNIAVLSFADTIRLSVFQNVEPSEILETERFGIETGNSIRGSYP